MAFVNTLMDWMINLITGVLGSIIASILLAFCGWRLIHRIREAKDDVYPKCYSKTTNKEPQALPRDAPQGFAAFSWELFILTKNLS